MTATRRGLAAAALLLPVAAAVAFFAAPFAGLLARTPWSELPEQLVRPAVLDALALSVATSAVSATLSGLFGLPLAFWLAAKSSWPRTIVRALVTLPIVLPPVVAGVALLLAYGRHGLVGAPAESALGIVLPFTTAAVVVAQTYVAMPFFVLAVEAGLRTLDRRYLDAAATLGASPWARFVRVTLPLLAPSLGVGFAVAWARALGEFCATMTFAGNLQGSTRTLPLAVGTALETDYRAAIVLSLVLVVVSLVVLFALRNRWLPRR